LRAAGGVLLVLLGLRLRGGGEADDQRHRQGATEKDPGVIREVKVHGMLQSVCAVARRYRSAPSKGHLELYPNFAF
jgi:hypothetical protein